MTKYISPEQVLQQLAALKLQCPEIEEDEDGWALSVESETDVFELLRQIERRRQEAETMAGALASNIAQMQLRQGRFEKREQAMRLFAFRVMQIADISKAELAEATLSIIRTPRKVIITNPEAIPDTLQRIERTPNKSKIKELLLDGGSVPGAALSNGDATISIRTK